MRVIFSNRVTFNTLVLGCVFHSCRFTDKVITRTSPKRGVITFMQVITSFYCFFTARTSSIVITTRTKFSDIISICIVMIV